MPRSRAYLINRVAARVDEVIPTADNVGGMTGTEDPISTIDDELDFSAVYVLRTGSLNVVLPAIIGDLKHFHGDSVEDVSTRIIVDTTSFKATIPCPDNFLRLVSLRIDECKTDIKELQDPRSPRYHQQEINEFTGGNIYKPEAFLVGFTSYIVAEQTKWSISQTLAENEALATLYNGQTPASSGATVLATDDIIALSGQDDDDENGIYKVLASGSPTKLSSETSNAYVNSKQGIEVYRVSSASASINHFQYVPRLEADKVPDDLVDAMIEHCAGRVFMSMGNMGARDKCFEQADKLLGVYSSGIKGQV